MDNNVSFHFPDEGLFKKMGRNVLEKAMAISDLNKVMKQIRERGGYTNIGSGLVKYFDIEMSGCETKNFDSIKDREPLLIVANHPYGLPDGAMIAEVVMAHLKRTDYKFFVSHIVTKIFPELKKRGFSIENLNLSSKAVRNNAKTLLSARNHLREGGMMIMFPAGQVSGLRFYSEKGILKVCDFEWDEGFISLALASKATILPVLLEGNNSLTFLFWRSFGKMFGRLCLFREFIKLTPREIRVRVKKPFVFEDYRHLKKGAFVKLLRKMIYSK